MPKVSTGRSFSPSVSASLIFFLDKECWYASDTVINLCTFISRQLGRRNELQVNAPVDSGFATFYIPLKLNKLVVLTRLLL